jgi:hypothetical protein
MKKRISILATALLAIALTSCMNLGDDTKVVRDYMCMVTVSTGGASPVFQMDEGPFLSSETTLPTDTFIVGERYFIDFIFGDTVNHADNTYPIRVASYGKTTIKSMIELPKDSTDRWGSKPIAYVYPSFSGHYFNAFFSSYAGISDPNSFEFIRMKVDEHTTPTDTVPSLFFQLRHNADYVSTALIYYRFYSFDLSSLTTDFPNAHKFKIKVSWDDANVGWTSITGNYTPDQHLSLPSLLTVNQKSIDLEPSMF